ncbi:MAG: tetratricopeptide repeat protein [Microcoleaceae cyanobacterium MO_207.B10]|nr:tetratricopeptide repeat protein [Microcoleaceae cyanobacterium MO_207.B10]
MENHHVVQLQNQAENLTNKGLLCQQEGKLEEAVFYYQQALDYNPNLQPVHYNLGIVLHQQGDLLGAYHSYQTALSLEPNDINTYYNLGIVLQNQGLLAAAIQNYQQAINLSKTDDSNNLESVVNSYSNWGFILLQKGQPDAAISVFKKALLLKPKDFTIHNNIGKALLQKRKLERAIASFEIAVKLAPEFATAYHNIGKVYQYRGLHQEAVVYFQQVIKLEPENIAAYSDCGYSLMEQGKLSAAITYLQTAIQNNAFIEGYCKWADLLAESKDELDKAKVTCAQFLKALQSSSSLAEIIQPLVQTYLHLGNVSAEYGRHNQAEFYYKNALNIQPRLGAEYYLKLANSLVRQNRINSAIIIAHLGLATYPNNPQISENFKSLSKQKTSLKKPDLRQSSCQGLNCKPCLQRNFKEFNRIHLGSRIYTLSENKITDNISRKNKSLKVVDPKIFVAKLPQGRAWVVPQKNSWMICNAIAIINQDNKLIKELSREYPGQLPGCKNNDINKHRIFELEELPPLEKIDGTVAVLSGLSGNVYFHWMVDILPRLEILKIHGIDLAEIDRFLVNSYQQPFQRETLKILGVPEEKIIESDRHPHIQAEKLIVPSFPGYLGWLPSWALEFHRRVFLNIIKEKINAATQPQKLYPERIYISRNSSRYRRVFNEEEVISKLTQLGFVCIYPELMTLTEQIAIFAHAKVIIAAHGSGLTNIMFCSAGSKVIELVSPNYIRHYYWVISQQLGLEHYYLKGEDFTCYPIRQLMYQNPLTEDIIVNLKSLEKILKITGIIENINIQATLFSSQVKASIQNYPQISIRENLSDKNSTPVVEYPVKQKMSLTVNSLETAVQLHQRAELYLKQKELAAAKTTCEQALKQQPDYAPACKTLGNIFHIQEQLEPAWYWYKKAIELEPNFGEAYTNLGTLYAQKEQWQEAIAYYQKAIEIQPDLSAAYRNLARAYDKIGNHKEAVECRKQAYSLEPGHQNKNQPAPTPIVMPKNAKASYKLLGKMLQSQGQIEAAWQSYKKAISLYPNDHENYLNIGTLYAQQQQWVEAIQCYKKSLSLNQNYADAYRNLAIAWKKIGKEAEASNCWYRAYTLEPEKATAEEHLILGNTLLRQNIIDQAISCYCRAIELNPNLLGAYENLGEALKLQGTKKPTTPVFPNHWQNQANSLTLLTAETQGIIQQVKSENQIQIVQKLKNFERIVSDLVSTVTSAFNLKNDLSDNYLESSLSLVENSQQQLNPNSPEIIKTVNPTNSLLLEPDLTNIYWNLDSEKPSLNGQTKTNNTQIIHSGLQQNKISEINHRKRINVKLALPPDGAVNLPDVYIKQAQNYYERGLYEQAINQCQQAISIKPDAVKAYIIIGDSQQKIGETKAAEKNYQKAIELNPKNASIHTQLANLYSQQKLWQLAIYCYQKAAAIQPNEADNYRNLAKAWTELGEVQAATDCWYQAYSLEPKKVTATEHFNLGNKLYKQGQITQAVSCYNHSIKLDPNLATAYYNLSVALKRLGRPDEAVIYHHKAKKIWENKNSNQSILNSHSSPKVEIKHQNDYQQNATEINQESLKSQQLNKIVQNGQKDTQVEQLQETFEKAKTYYLEGLLEEAIATCEALIKIKPQAEVYQIMGKAFQDKVQIDKAINCYRQALQINPNLAPANYGIGQILAMQKNWSEAISYYRQALYLLELNLDTQNSIELTPDSWEVYQQLGDALQEIGQIEEAVKVYHQALDLSES